MTLSVVSPAMNEASGIGRFCEELRSVLEQVPLDWEIVLVDDGSTDNTWDVIESLANADSRIRGIRLSRNFGHQLALSAGIEAAMGDGVVTMDSDLQHPPSAIPEMLRLATEGFDVIYGVRSTRDSEGWLKVKTAGAFYALFNKLSGLDIPPGAADFRYMSRRVVEALKAMPEQHRFLRGMTRWAGFQQTVMHYDRAERDSGESKYTMRRMIRLATDGIVSFSALPLKVSSVMGIVLSMLGGFYLVYVVVIAATTERAIHGWPSVMGAVLMLGGAQLAAIGIMGTYIGRLYEQSKGRPLFLISEDTAKHVSHVIPEHVGNA